MPGCVSTFVEKNEMLSQAWEIHPEATLEVIHVFFLNYNSLNLKSTRQQHWL